MGDECNEAEVNGHLKLHISWSEKAQFEMLKYKFHLKANTEIKLHILNAL